MATAKQKPETIADYIKAAPKEAQPQLRQIHAILKKVAPKATEAIKWGAPVFEEKRILFSFSAFKDHITFMVTGPSMKPFKKELENFTTGKDTVQFPYGEPLPAGLIRKMAAHRLKEVQKGAKWMYAKKSTKKVQG
jgi:uncharacterized protein YdhG (YjbR/CyaY superfamily)